MKKFIKNLSIIYQAKTHSQRKRHKFMKMKYDKVRKASQNCALFHFNTKRFFFHKNHYDEVQSYFVKNLTHKQTNN